MGLEWLEGQLYKLSAQGLHSSLGSTKLQPGFHGLGFVRMVASWTWMSSLEGKLAIVRVYIHLLIGRISVIKGG